LANGNAIEIYKITNNSMSFEARQHFNCNIARLEVIPSKHHDHDYIFIVDELGRFAFWRPEKGF
jgi:hypothetical protein